MDDIYFDRISEFTNDRAYTRIDFNRATVGNQWIERIYSGFFGTTNSLQTKGLETEWVISQNPEFSLVVDGETINPMDLGELDVSDECSELGATLLLTKSGTNVEVSMAITALHEVPAMLRTLEVTNRGTEPIQLESVTSEIMAWEPEEAVFLTQQFRNQATESHQCDPSDTCIAVMAEQHGMLYGVLGEGELHVHRPEAQQCRWFWPCNQTLAPRESWTSAESFLIPCDADPHDTYRMHHSAMITQLKLAQRKADQVRKVLEEEAKALEEEAKKREAESESD